MDAYKIARKQSKHTIRKKNRKFNFFYRKVRGQLYAISVLHTRNIGISQQKQECNVLYYIINYTKLCS